MVLLLFPLIISFLAYQITNRISFAHETRSAIDLMYLNLCPAIYKYGLDLLTHYPSSRNIETYHGKLVHGKGLQLLSFSTSVVTAVFGLLPFVAVVYCFVQTFQRDDVSNGAWILSSIIAGILIFRTIVMQFFSHVRSLDPYSDRKKYYSEYCKETDNKANAADAKSRAAD